MTDRILNIGLIGCGKQAPKHIAGLKSFKEPVKITVCDVKFEFAQSISSTYSVGVSESPEALLADPSIDGVVIATPTPTHFQLITNALDHGKHVFCEKPLCASRAEAIHLRAKVQESGRLLQVGYVYRMVPVFRMIHDMLNHSDQPLGKPVSAILRIGGRGSAAVWKHRKETGGGAINEMLVHMADLAQWFLGPLENVRCHERKLLRDKRVIDGQEVDVDAEDLVVVSAKAANGADVLLQADMLTPAFRQYVEIQGDNGSFMGSIQHEIPSFIHLINEKGGYPAGRTDVSGPKLQLFEAQMRDYLDHIQRNTIGAAPSVADSIRMFSFLEALT